MLRALAFSSLIVIAMPAAASELAADAKGAASKARGLATQIVAAAFVGEDTKAQALADFEKEFVAGFKSLEHGRLFAERRPDLLAAVLQAGRAEFSRQCDRVMIPAMPDAIAGLYASKLTSSELRDALAYYQTPQAQRLLASFTTDEAKRKAEIDAAAADPVVVRYRASAAGLKEQSIGGDVTDAMMKSALRSAASIMPAANRAITAAMAALLSKATP